MRSWMTAAVLCVIGLGAQAQGLPLIDTHAHFQPNPARDFEAALATALKQMDQVNAARTILMPPPIPHQHASRFFDIEQLVFARAAHPDRVVLMGGGSSLNVMIHETPSADVDDEVRARFRRRAEDILAQGAVGFGEIGILHVSIPAMGPEHPYSAVEANHPLLLLLADIAAEHDVPMDLHFDLVPDDMPLPDVLRPNRQNPSPLKPHRAHRPSPGRICWRREQCLLVIQWRLSGPPTGRAAAGAREWLFTDGSMVFESDCGRRLLAQAG